LRLERARRDSGQRTQRVEVVLAEAVGRLGVPTQIAPRCGPPASGTAANDRATSLGSAVCVARAKRPRLETTAAPPFTASRAAPCTGPMRQPSCEPLT